MRAANLSVPEVVREIITKNRSIYDCMKMDIVNYTALAVKIQPEVERYLRNPVNLNTVVVAIKRYADSFEQKEDIKEESVLKDARLSLTDGILDIKISAHDLRDQNAVTLLDKFSQITPDYDFFRMADSFRFLTEDVADIRRLFESMSDGKNVFSTGLAKIKISVPREHNRSDVVSYVAEVLHTNGIELINAFFSQDSITIIVGEKDASRAYEILRSEIVR
ncbi:MAG: ACT domain-containing protein [Nitrosopumilaceae archaeon]